MRTVYKYPLDITYRQTLTLPVDYAIRHVAMQGSQVCVWVEGTTDLPTEPVDFYLIGTGHALPDEPARHVGTVQDREFVWHVYKGTKE